MNQASYIKPTAPERHRGTASALFKTLTDPRTPAYAKLLPLIVLLYTVFPFDVIPDIIPFAGWIDDLLVIPIGLWLAMRFIPPEVLADVGSELGVSIAKLKKRLLYIGIGFALLCAVITGLIVTLILLLFRIGTR